MTNQNTNTKQGATKTRGETSKTINLPSKVWDANWKDDIDPDAESTEDVSQKFLDSYELFENEAEYISPESVSNETQAKLNYIKEHKNVKYTLRDAIQHVFSLERL